MTHYRASEALCHWRHLTIITTEANVNGVAVAAEDVTAATRQVLVDACHLFRRNVINYSLGMCWFQQDIFFFPDEWTLGEPYTVFTPGGYITTYPQAEEGCATVGVRAPTYDSVCLVGPHITYVNGPSGVSFADAVTHDFYHWTEYHLTWGVSVDAVDASTFLGSVMTHEWSHQVDHYFGDYGMGQLTPFPDLPNDYRWSDGTAFNPDDVPGDFLRAFFSGQIEDIATSTVQGCTPEVWALGPVRKNYPR